MAYASERTQFGKPIAGFQLVQDMIADISRRRRRRPAAGLAGRRPDRPRRAVRHRGVQGQALRLRGRRARGQQLRSRSSAATGYVDEYPVAKYLRDARVMTLYEGTSQIQKLLIGRAETGISAFV